MPLRTILFHVLLVSVLYELSATAGQSVCVQLLSSSSLPADRVGVVSHWQTVTQQSETCWLPWSLQIEIIVYRRAQCQCSKSCRFAIDNITLNIAQIEVKQGFFNDKWTIFTIRVAQSVRGKFHHFRDKTIRLSLFFFLGAPRPHDRVKRPLS